MGDVKVTGRYIVVNVPQTKTIFRPVPIPLARASVIKDSVFLDSALNAYTSLMHYLNIHPGYPDRPDYPLWYDTNNSHKKPLSKDGVTAVFRRLGKAAGLQKTVTTYVLRRTAFNRFRGADREKLNAGFGWKPVSPLVELPATATLEQFHADQKAQEELEAFRKENEQLTERLDKIEEVLSAMRQLPGIDEIIQRAVEASEVSQ